MTMGTVTLVLVQMGKSVYTIVYFITKRSVISCNNLFSVGWDCIAIYQCANTTLASQVAAVSDTLEVVSYVFAPTENMESSVNSVRYI